MLTVVKDNFSNYILTLSHRRIRGAADAADIVVKSAMLLQNSVILVTTLAMTAMRTTTAKFRTMGCRPCGVGKMGKMDMASEVRMRGKSEFYC